MLASISPVGEASRKQRWTVTVTAYTVGSTVAGGSLGAVLGGLGGLGGYDPSGPVPLAVLAVAALLAAVADRAGPPRPLGGWRRQVDERWLTEYRGWVYGAGYGLQLGAAVLTIVPTTAIYVVLLAAVLSGNLGAGAVIGASFGLVRALPLVLTAWVRSPQALRELHRRVDAATASVAQATVIALGVIGGLAAVAAMVTATA